MGFCGILFYIFKIVHITKSILFCIHVSNVYRTFLGFLVPEKCPLKPWHIILLGHGLKMVGSKSPRKLFICKLGRLGDTIQVKVSRWCYITENTTTSNLPNRPLVVIGPSLFLCPFWRSQFWGWKSKETLWVWSSIL